VVIIFRNTDSVTCGEKANQKMHCHIMTTLSDGGGGGGDDDDVINRVKLRL
jgi:hypothetical protein